MNPDYYGPLYPESTVSKCIAEYELTSDTCVYLFRVHDNIVHVICSGRKEDVVVSREEARKIWCNLVGQGYEQTGISIKQHQNRKMKRNQKVMKSISDNMEEWVKEIHENELQEMRINPKKFYKNYALEA